MKVASNDKGQYMHRVDSGFYRNVAPDHGETKECLNIDVGFGEEQVARVIVGGLELNKKPASRN